MGKILTLQFFICCVAVAHKFLSFMVKFNIAQTL